MSEKHTIIRLRRGTAAEWAASLPQPYGEVLKLGEPGFEKDTFKLKIGDGITGWNNLPYIADGMGSSNGNNNGPLKYTYDVDFIGNGGTQVSYSGYLTSQPAWMDSYPELTGFTENGETGNDFGFDNNGLWFTGDAQPSSESYPVRTNFDIPSNARCEITYTVNYNDGCADQGICFFKTGDSPQWNWGVDPSRIAIQSNCPAPSIYGLNSENEGNEVLSNPNYYTYKIVYIPLQSTITVQVYLGQDTNGTVLETLTLNERLTEGTDYRIGFAADQDSNEVKSYFTNLTIVYGEPTTQIAVSAVSDTVDFSEFFQQLIDSNYHSTIKISKVTDSDSFVIYNAGIPSGIEAGFVFNVSELVNNNLAFTNGIQYYINFDIIGSSTTDIDYSVTNLKACSIELTGNPYYASEPVVVYQQDSSPQYKVYDAIDTNLTLTRGTDSWDGGGGLYNSILQEDYQDGGNEGPAGTEWNADGWNDLSNIASRTYNSLYNVLNGNIGKEITNAKLVMHDTINDKYYKFDFTYWQPGGGQNVGPEYPIGGFRYVRTQLWVAPEPVTFTRPPNSAETVDNIDTGLTIKRSGGGGIFNSESETEWNVSISPSGTLWNIEGWDNLSNVSNREYVSFYAATGGQLGNMVTTRQYIMKDTINNKYYKVSFNSWGGSNGSFEYVREQINGYCHGNIVFGDGTIQSTAYNSSAVSGIIDSAFNTSLVAGSGIDFSYNSGILTINSNAQGIGIGTIDLHNGGVQNAQILQFDNTSYQAVITGPTPIENNNAQRLIIQGQRASGTTSEGGDVYLWGGDANYNGGDIKIYAGDADNVAPDSGYGGYVNIDGGKGATNAGNVEITAGYSEGGHAGHVNIVGGPTTSGVAGNVNIKTNNNIYNWIFAKDGSLTLPGVIQNANSFEIKAGPTEYAVQFLGQIDNGFGDAPGATLHVTSIISGVITNGMTIYGDGLPAEGWLLEFGTVMAPQGSGGIGNYYLPGANYLIGSQAFNNGDINNNTWLFDTNRNLTIPGNIILSNNSTVATGTYDTGYGGNGGISLNCVVGYELNWQAGRLKSTYNNGLNTVNILSDSGLEFPGSGVDNMEINSSGLIFPDGTTQNTAASGLTFEVYSAPRIITNAFNETGSQIPKFKVVYINGGHGDQPTINLAIASGELTSSKTYGVTAENIDNMSIGQIIVIGSLTGLDTDQFNPTAPTGNVNGVTLWLSPTVPGGVTTTKPSAPNHAVSIGTIVRTHQNEGIVEVRIQNGYEIEELHNVKISGVSHKDVLVYNSGNSLWENNNTLIFSNPSGIPGATAITNIVQISQTDYDNLPSIDPNTVYIINS